MRGTRVAILLLILLSFQAKAQIEQEIKSFVDSTEIIVNNGRKMMMVKLSDKNDQKAKEIYQYLSSITADKNSAAFDYTEDIYTNLLVGDWHTASSLMKDYTEKTKKHFYPKDNQLTTILYDRVSQASDSLLAESQKSGLDEESKKVIELILHLTKTRAIDPEYNQLLKEYHKQYKESGYKEFLKNYLPGIKARASMALSLGSGMILPMSNLADNFSSNASFNLSMDININKIYTSFYLTGSNLHLKVPFSVRSETDSLAFSKDESFHYLEGGMKAGYFLVRSDRFHVAPFVTISGTVLESTRFDDVEDDDREYPVINSFSYGPGIHTEFKLKEYNKTDVYGDPLKSFLSIKLDAGYNFIAKYDEKVFKGNIPTVTFALVWGMGNF